MRQVITSFFGAVLFLLFSSISANPEAPSIHTYGGKFPYVGKRVQLSLDELTGTRFDVVPHRAIKKRCKFNLLRLKSWGEISFSEEGSFLQQHYSCVELNCDGDLNSGTVSANDSVVLLRFSGLQVSAAHEGVKKEKGSIKGYEKSVSEPETKRYYAARYRDRLVLFNKKYDEWLVQRMGPSLSKMPATGVDSSLIYLREMHAETGREGTPAEKK